MNVVWRYEMDKKTVGIISVVMLLLGFGGSQTLSSDELSNAYVCPLTKELGIFPEGLSSSGKTGYYIDSTGTKKGESCNEGRTFEPWISLVSYAELNNVNVAEFLNEQTPEDITLVQVKGTQGIYYCPISNGVLETYTLCQKNGREVYAGELLIEPRS